MAELMKGLLKIALVAAAVYFGVNEHFVLCGISLFLALVDVEYNITVSNNISKGGK